MEFGKKDVLKTKEQLERVINPTPLQYSKTFSGMAGCRIYLKPECLQKNGSFKIRGAYSALSFLSGEEKERGIITSSGGNWSQGVAYGCQQLGVKALIVMPEYVSKSKHEATKSYGAETLLYGSSSLDIIEKVKELRARRGMTWIHAFREPEAATLRPTLLGYGTIGLEILEEQPEIEAIAAPVGGGALISGIALAARSIKPGIKIFGVQPERAAAMSASLKSGKVVEISGIHTLADGLALKRPGEATFQLVRDNVDELVLVKEDEIKQAVLLLLERAKLLVEPSGAVPLAALLNGKIKGLKKDSRVAVVLSGGNIDLPVLKGLLP